MSRLLTALVTAALMSTNLIATSASAESFYKWTDDDGTVNYTRLPPEGRPSEKVSTFTKHSEPVKYTTEQFKEESKGEKTEKKVASAQTSPTQAPTKDPVRCEQARKNLNKLNNNSRIRTQSASGEMRYLTPEEINQKKAEMQQVVQESC